MDWRLKALAFRVLDLPGGSHAHYFLQRRLTRNWPRPSSTLNALAGIAQRVTVLRDGRTQQVQVKLGTRPPNQ